MNLINRMLLNKGEKALLPFRSVEDILKTDSFSSYHNFLPFIQSCYKEAKYWHGTGRYQYAHAEHSRYENSNNDSCIDILESVLREGGLRPHDEPWHKKLQDMVLPTISLTPFCMYARLYAGLYLYEKDSLVYEFGAKKFWFQILICIQFFNKSFLRFLVSRSVFKLVSKGSRKDIQTYIGSIRKDNSEATSVFVQGHLIRTDIPNNYPILIGIRKVDLIPFNPGMERLEVRTGKLVSFKDITHLEVPLSNVKETEDILKLNNVSVPVIPLEFGEMYCSSFRFKELVGIK